MKGAMCMFLDCIGLFALPLLFHIYPADPKMLVMLHVFFLPDFLGAFSLSWFILWCIFSINSSLVLLRPFQAKWFLAACLLAVELMFKLRFSIVAYICPSVTLFLPDIVPFLPTF